jgi:hypothetical protein
MAGLDHLEPYMAHDFRCYLNHFGCPVRIVFSRECQNRAGDVSKPLRVSALTSMRYEAAYAFGSAPSQRARALRLSSSFVHR